MHLNSPSVFPIALVVALSGIAAPVSAQERTITVSGMGEVSVEPDMATIFVGVQTDAPDAAVALDTASASTAAILAILAQEGIDGEDIATGTIRLNPRYSDRVAGSEREISGYQATNSLEVQVLDLDRLGAVLAAVVGDTEAGRGANRLDGVQFGLVDSGAAMDEARKLAVAEGVRLANLYATAAGVRVGDVVQINEAGGGGYRPVMAEARQFDMAVSSAQYDVPVSAGQIELSASIVMVFEIAD